MSIKSKERVRDQGEVFTSEREVSSMLGLVQHETERIESRFLEPACGDGNFLAPILERKLELVAKKYKKSQLEYERTVLIAIGSIYGVEFLKDNVKLCQKRLYNLFLADYKKLFGRRVKPAICDSAEAIIKRNILWGDALSLTTPDEKAEHIVFSEWSRPFNDSRIKRHDYYFHELTPQEKKDLFSQSIISDEGEEGFIPRPVKSFPLTHITKIGTL
ncbi:SAM-dependent DNA methyltransferase [Candidatus Saccharibacteria bacterium]|nr:SAM-dependent DNA methyltransferase [Candidatus Saccharibacteria bacterium]